MTTRREFLSGAGAGVALAIVGAPVGGAATLPQAVKPLPAWEVGSGEWGWRVIFAETKEEAQRLWYVDAYGYEPNESCDCGCGTTNAQCEKYCEGLPETWRTPHWDNSGNEEPCHEDLFRAGWSTRCDRCSDEINMGDGECDVVDHECVCHDCMTDDELRAVSPDHRRFDPDDEETI